jgi:hypothetical protein
LPVSTSASQRVKLLQDIRSLGRKAIPNLREVLDCDSPLPLSLHQAHDGIAAEGCRSPRRWRAIHPQTIFILFTILFSTRAQAVTFTENFSADPAANGWLMYGDTNLFKWDSTNQHLRITWDSSKTNSYFHRPLGTTLSRDDDFSLSFDVMLEDYAIGTTPGKFSTFELAIGFLNLDQATQTNFFRGAGINATYGPKNLVEFNFFPAFDSFLPTLGQVIVSTNNAWLYNDSNLLDMTPHETFQVRMDYVAATHTLTTVISNHAGQYGSPQNIVVPANFDFRVTALSISSYSDGIQPPPPGSILAHGTVDDFVVVTPPPPVENLTGAFAGANWQVQFSSRTNWLYTLERTANLVTWTNASLVTSGTGATLTLTDQSPTPTAAFYRVRANRP